MRTISVIGTGYLGATHAACLADLGFDVIGIDTDPEKVAALSAGRLPFFEPDLEPLIRKYVEHGRLRFSTDIADAADAEVHFLCVGTPQRADGPGADLSAVHGAVAVLAPHLRRPCLVVGKSTVPVGTAATVADELRDTAPAGDAVHLAWSPEFLREGRAVEDTLRPDRLVFGVTDPCDLDVLRAVHRDALAAGVPEVVTDLATAELVKTAANSFLATKVSFVNAMAEVCDAAGADVLLLTEALAHDGRIGAQFLRPGLGFGGGCLPKDVRAFVARAEELGVARSVSFLRDVDAINARCRLRAVELAAEELGGSVAGRTVAVLGAAFKPGSDDVRDSPALAVAAALQERGAVVRVHDPKARDAATRAAPELDHLETVADACADADLVLLATEWPQYVQLDPEHLARLVRGRRVVDTRHALDEHRWRAAGWRYRAPGRPFEPVRGGDGRSPGSPEGAVVSPHETRAPLGGAAARSVVVVLGPGHQRGLAAPAEFLVAPLAAVLLQPLGTQRVPLLVERAPFPRLVPEAALQRLGGQRRTDEGSETGRQQRTHQHDRDHDDPFLDRRGELLGRSVIRRRCVGPRVGLCSDSMRDADRSCNCTAHNHSAITRLEQSVDPVNRVASGGVGGR